MQVIFKNADAAESAVLLAVTYNCPIPRVGEVINVHYQGSRFDFYAEVLKVIHHLTIQSIGTLDSSYEGVTIWVKEKDRLGRTDEI